VSSSTEITRKFQQPREWSMSEDDPQVPFEPARRPEHYRLPQKPRSSRLGLTIGILIVLAILVGGGVAIHLLMQRNNEAATPPPPPRQPAPAVLPKTLQPSAVPWPATAPTVKPSPTTDDAVVELSPAPNPNDPTSADWERVQQVYRTSPPELAIIALMDFLESSPTSTFAPTAQEQINQSLDRLWWIRIQSLCRQRTEMNRRIGGIDEQLRIVKSNSPDPQRVKELEEEKAPYASQRDVIQGHLDEMKYNGTATPDLYDEPSLAELRKQRDAAAYDAWQKKTAAYIKRNRGKLPW
jgi:hypothetical protein